MNKQAIIVALSTILVAVQAANSLDWVWNIGSSNSPGNFFNQANNQGNTYPSSGSFNQAINPGSYNSASSYNGINGFNPTPPAFGPIIHPGLCQVVRKTHPVQYVSYSDSNGRWALYTQILETRNVGNRCNVNEVVLLSHRQPSGWFWNPKLTSLLNYAQEEPRFATRQVSDPFNVQRLVNVNLSRANETPNTSLHSAFTDYMAKTVLGAGHNDAKWLEVARQLSSQLNQNTLYFQYVKHHLNAMAVPLSPLPPAGSPQAMQMSIRE